MSLLTPIARRGSDGSPGEHMRVSAGELAADEAVEESDIGRMADGDPPAIGLVGVRGGAVGVAVVVDREAVAPHGGGADVEGRPQEHARDVETPGEGALELVALLLGTVAVDGLEHDLCLR